MLLFAGCNENSMDVSIVAENLNSLSVENKIWAHRVNSLENIKERTNEFYGIEVDIFYDSKVDNFIVKHDLDSAGLNLDFFLDSVLKVKKLSFWFDYKNLNLETGKGVSKLCEILYNRKLEKVSFVESYFISELEKFENKLATSLWVPAAVIPVEKKVREHLFKKQYKNFQTHTASMLSASYEMFDFLIEYFPNQKCNYWMSGETNEEQISLLKKMANSSNTNVILVDGLINPFR